MVAILTWLEGYLGGKWLALFSLLADSSARIGAVLSLRGRDVNRTACEVTFRKTKTDWRTVAIPPATIALLPEPGPTELLFPGMKPGRPYRRESVRDVLHRAMRAIGVLDPEWLSTHSFRRAWVATSRREGIPAELAMKHTGHEDVKVFHAYQRNAVGDDMHDVAARVRAARRRASARNGAPLNGTEAVSKPVNGTEAVSEPVNDQACERAASNDGAACKGASSTNEAGGSHLEGVS
ncbi:MAG: site-specific integrase, partial [Planctomycetes bacterium]|nr:site-specific integrase [Planctomycetota bacterium]